MPWAHFHQLTQQEEGSAVADTGRLLHVVGDDDHGVVLFQLAHELLHLHGRTGVQGAGGFVHQQHFGLNSQGAGDAKALLLAAGKAQRALFQAVLHFVPEGRTPQRAFHQLIQLGFIAHAVELGAVGDVIVDAHGEGVCLLEHHAHPAAQAGELHLLGKDVLPFEPDVALDADAGDQIVHAVEGLQKGGFAAAGRADEGGDLLFAHVQGDVLQGLEIAVPEVQVFGCDNG